MSVIILTALGTIVWFLLREDYKDNKEFKREVLRKLDIISENQVNLDNRVEYLEERANVYHKPVKKRRRPRNEPEYIEE
nr:MAG TPA: hypothetical protein [Caudoviricetes sp.]